MTWRRPRILLAGFGGTIATALNEAGHGVAALGSEDLLVAIPAAEALVDVVPLDLGHAQSHALTPGDMCVLGHELRRRSEDVDGIVVTQGTDTMEETAYTLALQLDVNVPVVLTGAMRPPYEPGADGPANLMAALRVAATSEAADLGPVIVMHDEVHLARFATKTHTASVAAFSSPGLGPVGSIYEGRVRLLAAPRLRDHLGMPDALARRVELVWVAAGADGLLIDAVAEAGDGLVVAGTGGGHVPPTMMPSLRAAVKRGLPVVLASRCGAGPTFESTYGGAGSETELLALGLRGAGDLAPLKARLRLLTGLELGIDLTDVFPGVAERPA